MQGLVGHPDHRVGLLSGSSSMTAMNNLIFDQKKNSLPHPWLYLVAHPILGRNTAQLHKQQERARSAE